MTHAQAHGVVPGDDRRASSACLFGDDADGPATARRSASVEVHSPQAIEWGRHEGAVHAPGGQQFYDDCVTEWGARADVGIHWTRNAHGSYGA